MRISAETEQRVRDAITTLHYRPNRNAQSLRTATTSTIGIITDVIASGMFSSQLLAGANAAARAAEHVLVIGEGEGDADARDLLIDEMLDRRVDGIIFATHTALRTELPARLQSVRTVMLNCFDPEERVPAVMADDCNGGRCAGEILLRAGIETDVVIVGETPDTAGVAGLRRLTGIRAAFEEQAREISATIDCEWSPQPAYEALHTWLAHGDRPRGLVCMNDRAALGVYQALSEAGLTVPGDVSVVSFDGSELSSWLRPQLTSVALPLRQMGALAVELLLAPESDGASVHFVSMPVITGESVRPPLEPVSV
jgi:LacI family transcriptional regulator